MLSMHLDWMLKTEHDLCLHGLCTVQAPTQIWQVFSLALILMTNVLQQCPGLYAQYVINADHIHSLTTNT